MPGSGGSFLNVDGDGVEVETLKPAEDGRGYILRLLETSGRPHATQISSGLLKIERARQTNAVEDDQSEIPVGKDGVQIALPANGIVTVRMLLTPRSART